MELFSPNIKKVQETETTETPNKIPYISENGNPKKASYISGNQTFQTTPRKFLILQEMKTPNKLLIFSQKKAFLIFSERNFSYISGNPKKLFNFQEFLIFRGMEKISCTLGLLLILFTERELFKHKREINFLSLPAAAFAC